MSTDLSSATVVNGRALSWPQRFAYSIANFGVGFLPTVIGSWAMYYYAPPPDDPVLKPYIPLAVVGIVLALGRIAEALLNPFIGYWSDRTRSRFGRRMPYIMVGAPLMSIAFIAMWFPITPYESWINAIYITFLSIMVCSMFALVVAPYLSLLPELTPYNNERITVSSLMGVFEILGTLLAAAGTGFIIEAYKGGIGGDGPTGFNGFKLVGVVVGVITVFTYYVTPLFIREKPYSEAKAVRFKFWESTVSALKNPSFPPYIAAVAALRLSLDTVIVVIPYIVTTVMGGSESTASLLQAGILILAGLLFPVVAKWSEHAGKRKVFLLGSAGFVVVLPLIATVGKWPLFSPLTQGIIIFILAALPVATISVLQRPLMADIIDHDERLTGFRREALYNGMEGLFSRSASGMAWVLSSLLFFLFGNTVENPMGILICGPVAGVIMLIGLLAFRKYPFST